MERIWEGLNGFTQFSAVLISSIALLFHIKWSRRATSLGPTILTTLGIFFCFAGIAWGLLDFDPHSVLVIRGRDILGTHAQDPGRAVRRRDRTGVLRAGRIHRGRPGPLAGA